MSWQPTARPTKPHCGTENLGQGNLPVITSLLECKGSVWGPQEFPPSWSQPLPISVLNLRPPHPAAAQDTLDPLLGLSAT